MCPPKARLGLEAPHPSWLSHGVRPETAAPRHVGPFRCWSVPRGKAPQAVRRAPNALHSIPRPHGPRGMSPEGVSCLPHVLHCLHRELAVRTRSRSGSLAVVTGTGLCHVGVLKPLCTHSAVDKDGCSGQRAPLQRNPRPQDDRLPVLREAAWVRPDEPDTAH